MSLKQKTIETNETNAQESHENPLQDNTFSIESELNVGGEAVIEETEAMRQRILIR